jgi:tetratricopeptide (TPR) repeat protein
MDYDKFDACAHYLYRQFQSTGKPALVSSAIDAWEHALKVAVNREDTASSSKFLSGALYDQFCENGNPSIIPSAIRAVKIALGLTREDDPQFSDLLCDLGTYQRELFDIDRQLVNIEESISTLRKSLAIAESRNSESLPLQFSNLSLSLSKAFHFTGRLSFLEEAVGTGMRALELTEEDNPARPRRLFDLGLAFDARHSKERDPSDGDKTIEFMKQAIDAAEGNTEPHLIASLLDTLGNTLRFKFARTGDLSDIHQALDAHRRAVSMASEFDLPGFLNQLGVALDCAFYQSRDPQQIDEAVSAMRKSVALTKDGNPFLPERLRNMGLVLTSRFDYSTELKEIQEAISYFQKAVDVTPRESSLLALRLADLSNALVTRSTLTGEVLDMDEAIRVRREEIDSLDEGGGRLPRALADLGQILCRRFTMREDVGDVLDGICIYERAIKVAPKGFPEVALLHNVLGNAHHQAFAAVGDVKHIDAAIESKWRAISLLHEGHANVPLYFHNLGRSYRAKFQKDGRMETLEEAIRCQESAIEKSVGRSGGLPEWYADLSHSFHIKFQKTRDEVDIDRAVSLTEKALEILPRNHVDIPAREIVLGNFLITRSQLTKREDDVKRACEHYKRSALFSHGYTARRVEAARKWADLARTFDIESSLDGYERAIDLISAFVGLEQTQSRRHENIAQISDLSRAAAATALEADQVTRALDWLERGRCLVWSQLSSLRTPVDQLRLVDEQLAERLVAVSKALETSGSGSGKTRVGIDKDDSASLNSSVDLAVEWKDLVSSIRQKPGFEDFLETKVFSMEDLPSRGTVVVINVHETRCDALALRAGWNAPIHIALPQISLAKAKRMADGLRGYLGIGGVRLRGYEHDGEEDGEERAVRRMKRGATDSMCYEICGSPSYIRCLTLSDTW